MIPLSFTLQSQKGVYALLLGSGVSRAAQIPTGWDVVLELIGELAAAKGAGAQADPAAWYRTTFGKEPDYSEILEYLFPSPAARQARMRQFFEVTPDEREADPEKKVPTKAHRAIAKLMRDGYVRVVVTTNFDQLLEQALAELEVVADVISSEDAIQGMAPLHHTKHCIIKIHGDYRDQRIRNTTTELAAYGSGLNALLDEVFDRFGLIVCGWSGEWDPALKAAIERTPSRRYGFYWMTRSGRLSGEAERLVAHRQGTLVQAADADAFFVTLQETVASIEQAKRPNPATLQMLEAQVKRYLADDRHAIALDDLVHAETEAAAQAVRETHQRTSDSNTKSDGAAITGYFEQYRSASARLNTILMHAGAWSKPGQVSLWCAAIERLIDVRRSGYSISDWLRLYAPMVALYAVGLPAVAKGNWEVLRRVLYGVTIRDIDGIRTMTSDGFWADMHTPCNLMFGQQKHTPRSEHLFAVMREPMRRYFPSDEGYDSGFDLLEYTIALCAMDQCTDKSYGGPWAPPGRFCWKGRYGSASLLGDQKKALLAEGGQWFLLRAGFFGGSIERAQKAQANLDAFIPLLRYR